MENKKHINLQVKKYIGQCNYLKCKSQPSMKGKRTTFSEEKKRSITLKSQEQMAKKKKKCLLHGMMTKVVKRIWIAAHREEKQGQEMSNRCVLFRCKISSYKLLRYKDVKIY